MEEMSEKARSQSPDFSASSAVVVECDPCVGRKRKAEQTCLDCLASYCEAHLDLHNRLHGGKRHKLVEATESLQDITCPEHGKLLEVFCRTDQRCICYLCITDTHRTHDVVSTQVEVAEKKIQLATMQKKTSERIQTWEKADEDLRRAIKAFKASAEAAEVKSDSLFAELICCIKKMQQGVKDLILAQMEAVVKAAEELIGKVQENMSDLMGRDSELQHLKMLSQQHNYIQFLQSRSAFSISPLTKVLHPSFHLVHPSCSFELTTEAVTELTKKLNLFCQWSFITIYERVKNTGIVSSPLPRTRQELLKYATKLTLDQDTIHENIQLGEDDTVLTAVRKPEFYFPHHERFERRVQALCKEGLRGSPRYWEVKRGTRGSWVSVAVSYKGIRRSGRQAPLFGRCWRSWALRNNGYSCQFWHDNKETFIRTPSTCSRIGVYLDHGAGILAFYSVSSTTSLLLMVQTNFTEPVYAGFGLSGIGSQIKLCDLDSEGM